MKNFVFIYLRLSLNKAELRTVIFVPDLDWRPVIEESQLNASARTGKQLKLSVFVPLLSCLAIY